MEGRCKGGLEFREREKSGSEGLESGSSLERVEGILMMDSIHVKKV